MLGTILVPLDGKPLGERAIPLAEALARAAGASLLLLRAVPAAPARTTGTGGEGVPEAQAYLDRLAAASAGQGVRVATVVRRGDAVDVIVAETLHRPIGLIAIATRGWGLLERGEDGSLADALLDRVPVPLLLARDWHTDAAQHRLARGARVVAPLDGSPLAETALPTARALAAVFHGELILLHVVPTPLPWLVAPVPTADEFAITAVDQPALRAARAYLCPLVREVTRRGLQARAEVVAGRVPEEIAAAIRRHDAALVVMATHGETGMAQMRMGSVAKEVFWDGRVPLVLIRPAAMLAAAGSGTPS